MAWGCSPYTWRTGLQRDERDERLYSCDYLEGVAAGGASRQLTGCSSGCVAIPDMTAHELVRRVAHPLVALVLVRVRVS